MSTNSKDNAPVRKAKEALGRLLAIAQRDTGQSRRVADFLLSWWNAGSCGGFDITTAWGCDAEIRADMAIVFAWAIVVQQYPDTLGYERQFKAVIREWRPELDREDAKWRDGAGAWK